jgi:hypothetical protein
MIDDNVVYNLIDYDDDMKGLDYVGMLFSEDMKQSMSNYLFRGLRPGGHLEAMLAHDYERAFWNADTHSRTVIWATARWIHNHAPAISHGNYDMIQNWIRNDEARNEFFIVCSKKKMWTNLEQPS